jgi:hypothetical protein
LLARAVDGGYSALFSGESDKAKTHSAAAELAVHRAKTVKGLI